MAARHPKHVVQFDFPVCVVTPGISKSGHCLARPETMLERWLELGWIVPPLIACAGHMINL